LSPSSEDGVRMLAMTPDAGTTRFRGLGCTMESYVDHGVGVRSHAGVASAQGRGAEEPLCLAAPLARRLGVNAGPTFAGSERFCIGRKGAVVVVIASLAAAGAIFKCSSGGSEVVT